MRFKTLHIPNIAPTHEKNQVRRRHRTDSWSKSNYVLKYPIVISMNDDICMYIYRAPEGTKYGGLEEYVDKGTSSDNTSVWGRFYFRSRGIQHPRFVFESNEFVRFHLTEGNKGIIPCLESFFSRVHATLQPALTVGWLVGRSVGL